MAAQWKTIYADVVTAETVAVPAYSEFATIPVGFPAPVTLEGTPIVSNIVTELNHATHTAVVSYLIGQGYKSSTGLIYYGYVNSNKTQTIPDLCEYATTAASTVTALPLIVGATIQFTINISITYDKCPETKIQVWADNV